MPVIRQAVPVTQAALIFISVKKEKQMFTGIVEEMGTIRQIKKGRASAVLTIGAKKVLEDAHIGDSIAVNGICLTVTSLGGDSFTADVMHETLRRTALSRLAPGVRVNLERAMAADGRFGGHIVAGHVDGVGTVTDLRRDDNAIWYTFRADPQVLRFPTRSRRRCCRTVRKGTRSIWRRILSENMSKSFCMPDRPYRERQQKTE